MKPRLKSLINVCSKENIKINIFRSQRLMHICAKCFKKKNTLYVLVLFVGIAIICS